MLEFSDKKVVKTIMVPMAITEDDIENTIVSSFEGGSNYWMGLQRDENWDDKPKNEPSSTWATKLLLEGKSIKLFDVEETEDDSEWILTLEKLLDGFVKDFSNNPIHQDRDYWDAEVADCIMQYALFGEIVYG